MATTDRKHPQWSYNASIYELNMRQFTEEGTFTAAMAELPRLRALGVDIIWVMPIQPIGKLQRKGTLGSYYAIQDYLGVNPEYGTREELKLFIDTAHELGFKLLLDWVANHTSPDAKWVENKGWHKRDERGELAVQYDWYDITELDYECADMRRGMIDAMKYWVTDMAFDGLRCDMAMLVPTSFWEEAVSELKTVKPDLFMLSEAEEVDLTQKAFDMFYGWNLHHILNDVAKGYKNVYDIWREDYERKSKFDKSAIPMMFTSNHDENSHAGTEFQRMGNAAATMAVFTYVIPSMPLIYTGQELGNRKNLEFFEKDNLEPLYPEYYTALYTSLNKLRRENPALWSGELGGDMVQIHNSAGDKVFTMSRAVDKSKVLVVINLSSERVVVTLHEGDYEGDYKQFPDDKEVHISQGETFYLNDWEYRIYIKK